MNNTQFLDILFKDLIEGDIESQNTEISRLFFLGWLQSNQNNATQYLKTMKLSNIQLYYIVNTPQQQIFGSIVTLKSNRIGERFIILRRSHEVYQHYIRKMDNKNKDTIKMNPIKLKTFNLIPLMSIKTQKISFVKKSVIDLVEAQIDEKLFEYLDQEFKLSETAKQNQLEFLNYILLIQSQSLYEKYQSIIEIFETHLQLNDLKKSLSSLNSKFELDIISIQRLNAIHRKDPIKTCKNYSIDNKKENKNSKSYCTLKKNVFRRRIKTKINTAENNQIDTKEDSRLNFYLRSFYSSQKTTNLETRLTSENYKSLVYDQKYCQKLVQNELLRRFTWINAQINPSLESFLNLNDSISRDPHDFKIIRKKSYLGVMIDKLTKDSKVTIALLDQIVEKLRISYESNTNDKEHLFDVFLTIKSKFNLNKERKDSIGHLLVDLMSQSITKLKESKFEEDPDLISTFIKLAKEFRTISKDLHSQNTPLDLSDEESTKMISIVLDNTYVTDSRYWEYRFSINCEEFQPVITNISFNLKRYCLMNTKSLKKDYDDVLYELDILKFQSEFALHQDSDPNDIIRAGIYLHTLRSDYNRKLLLDESFWKKIDVDDKKLPQKIEPGPYRNWLVENDSPLELLEADKQSNTNKLIQYSQFTDNFQKENFFQDLNSLRSLNLTQLKTLSPLKEYQFLYNDGSYYQSKKNFMEFNFIQFIEDNDLPHFYNSDNSIMVVSGKLLDKSKRSDDYGPCSKKVIVMTGISLAANNVYYRRKLKELLLPYSLYCDTDELAPVSYSRSPILDSSTEFQSFDLSNYSYMVQLVSSESDEQFSIGLFEDGTIILISSNEDNPIQENIYTQSIKNRYESWMPSSNNFVTFKPKQKIHCIGLFDGDHLRNSYCPIYAYRDDKDGKVYIYLDNKQKKRFLVSNEAEVKYISLMGLNIFVLLKNGQLVVVPLDSEHKIIKYENDGAKAKKIKGNKNSGSILTLKEYDNSLKISEMFVSKNEDVIVYKYRTDTMPENEYRLGKLKNPEKEIENEDELNTLFDLKLSTKTRLPPNRSQTNKIFLDYLIRKEIKPKSLNIKMNNNKEELEYPVLLIIDDKNAHIIIQNYKEDTDIAKISEMNKLQNNMNQVSNFYLNLTHAVKEMKKERIENPQKIPGNDNKQDLGLEKESSQFCMIVREELNNDDISEFRRLSKIYLSSDAKNRDKFNYGDGIIPNSIVLKFGKTKNPHLGSLDFDKSKLQTIQDFMKEESQLNVSKQNRKIIFLQGDILTQVNDLYSSPPPPENNFDSKIKAIRLIPDVFRMNGEEWNQFKEDKKKLMRGEKNDEGEYDFDNIKPYYEKIHSFIIRHFGINYDAAAEVNLIDMFLDSFESFEEIKEDQPKVPKNYIEIVLYGLIWYNYMIYRVQLNSPSINGPYWEGESYQIQKKNQLASIVFGIQIAQNNTSLSLSVNRLLAETATEDETVLSFHSQFYNGVIDQLEALGFGFSVSEVDFTFMGERKIL